MNITIKSDQIFPIHLACRNGNIEEVENIINEDINNIYLKDDSNEVPLILSIKSFLSTNNSLGDITPKYFDNPYVKIIIKLINNGANFNSNILHSILFSDKPIFTMDDLYDITTNRNNKFPIHNAIELSNLCKMNSNIFDCYKREYIYLYNK